jgi:hypothetical protein
MKVGVQRTRLRKMSGQNGDLDTGHVGRGHGEESERGEVMDGHSSISRIRRMNCPIKGSQAEKLYA